MASDDRRPPAAGGNAPGPDLGWPSSPPTRQLPKHRRQRDGGGLGQPKWGLGPWPQPPEASGRSPHFREVTTASKPARMSRVASEVAAALDVYGPELTIVSAPLTCSFASTPLRRARSSVSSAFARTRYAPICT